MKNIFMQKSINSIKVNLIIMIKKVFFIVFYTIIPYTILTISPEQSKLFSGSIEFPCSLDFDLCLFYQGQKLEIESSKTSSFVQFSFLDNKDVHTIYLIISNNFTCNTQCGNTVECLQLANESSYICYKMQAKREFNDEEHQILTWDISLHHLDNCKIPNNSLIFLFEPKLIAGLKVQSWKPENLFRIIPTLVINPNTTAQEIQRAMVIARLTALDIDAIHTKATKLNPPTIAPLTITSQLL